MEWPPAAYRAHINGSAVLDCIVTKDGKLKPCVVVQEKPAGWGFAQAAVDFASTFRMKPKLRDGVPVGGAHIRLPINFEAHK
jgi:TonB family protein